MATPFIGEIRMFGGNFAPVNWALCNGQLLAISENTALFQLIGTTYGGDGQNTFALPNLQGRIPVHQATGFVIGQLAGEEAHTLTVNEIPSHVHTLVAATTATTNTPNGNHWGGGGANLYKPGPASAAMNATAVTIAGGSQPHDNMMPFLVVNFIIALFGIFPSQN